MEVHASATADDGRAGLPVHARDVDQADQGRVAGVDGPGGGADQQGRPGTLRVGGGDVGITVETALTRVVARLDLEEADVEARVAVRGEGEGAGDMHGAKGAVG